MTLIELMWVGFPITGAIIGAVNGAKASGLSGGLIWGTVGLLGGYASVILILGVVVGIVYLSDPKGFPRREKKDDVDAK